MGQTHTNEAKFTHCAGSLDIDLVSFKCSDTAKSFPRSRDAKMLYGDTKTLKAAECHNSPDKLTIYQGLARACEKNWKDDDCKKKDDFIWFDKQDYLVIGEQQFVYDTDDNRLTYCNNRRFLSNEVEASIARELLSEDACFEDSMDYQLNLYLDGDRTCFVADPGEDSGCAPFVMETEYPATGLPVKNMETYDHSTTPYDDLKSTHGYSPESDLVLNFGSYTYNSIKAAFNEAAVETEELAGFDSMISNKGVLLKNIALELGVVPSLLEVELIADILANNFPEVVEEIMDEDRVPDEVKSMPGFEIVHWFLQELL